VSLRDDLLPVCDEVRGLAGSFGLRMYTTVSVRTTTWSGERPGEGTAAVVDLALTANGQPVKVRQISSRIVQASAGRYEDEDLVIGPITPRFTSPTTGGYTPDQLKPWSGARNVERHVLLRSAEEGTGPAALWSIVQAHFEKPFGYELVVRKTEREVT